jgi:Transglutaminase-like superfamily
MRLLAFIVVLVYLCNAVHSFLFSKSFSFSTTLMASNNGGKFPFQFEQKLNYNVDRFAKILLDESSEEGKPALLLDWVKENYGTEKTSQLEATQFSKLSPPDQRKLLQQFLEWFRKVFPYYRDECEHCREKGCQFQGNQPPTEEERQCSPWIDHTEVSRCGKCQQLSRFPRYLTALEIARRKRGRCSEYSMLLYRILRALGHSARWVVDWADHVWAEVWMNDRWLHLDPCEAAVGTPMMYQGWGKKQTYIVAFEASDNKQAWSVVDVTQAYTKDTVDEILTRRKEDGATQEDIDTSIQRANDDLRQLSLLEIVDKNKKV